MTVKYIPNLDDSECEPLQTHTNSRHRILVVEDERDLRQITSEVLIDAGFQVDVAEDGGLPPGPRCNFPNMIC